MSGTSRSSAAARSATGDSRGGVIRLDRMEFESPLLREPGAVPADPPDTGIAAHYGNPLVEQRAAADGTAVVDRSDRDVVRIGGPDRLSWLHSLTTQHLTELAPGVATETLVLSPQGHVEHHLALVDDGEAVWAHVEPGTAPELISFLDSMRFLLDVSPEDVTADYALITLFGPKPGRAIEAARAPVVRRTADEVDLFVPRAELGDVVASVRDAGAELAGLWAYEAFRIAGHRPRVGFDTDHRTIPHEVGWIETVVHLDKGCYRGQETVARVYNLGQPPRRLVFLHLDGSVDTLPGHEAPVEYNGKQVGFVGSSAPHYELGPIALALVKRNTPLDAALLAGGVAAAQEAVVEVRNQPRVVRPRL